jgi:phosphonate transport system permease protein
MTAVAYELPSRKARLMWFRISAILVALVALTIALEANPLDLITQFHFIVDLADRMLPPNWTVLNEASVWNSIVETLAVATVGTIGGCFFALLAGLLAASNTTPHPSVRFVVRAAMAFERAITAIFILMILLIALGIGPFASSMTLIVSCIGMFGRLFADAIERAEPQPSESLIATGATRIQEIAFSVLPQVAPALLGLSLYAFEVNVRSAIALGLFGGGGLGFQLHVANSALRYQDVLGYAILSIILVSSVERISDAIRNRLLKT